MDYSRLFSWNPGYRVTAQTVMLHPSCTEDKPDNRIGVSILQKDQVAGWPDNPHKHG